MISSTFHCCVVYDIPNCGEYVVCSACNVELLESRPDLPRQTYEHSTTANTNWNPSASLDYCNTGSKSVAGAGSLCGTGPPTGPSSATQPRSALLSRTSSKSSVSRRSRPSSEDQRSASSFSSEPSTRASSNASSSRRTGPQSSEVRRVLSLRTSTQSSSSCLSHAASSSNQPLPVHDGQLLCLIISTK